MRPARNRVRLEWNGGDEWETDFDGGFDGLETMRSDSECPRSLDQFQITERSEFDREVLERLIRLVDDEDVEEDVELLYVDVCFGVDRVGESSELNDASEFRDKVFFCRIE